MWCGCGEAGRVTLVGDKVDRSGGSRRCDVVEMTTREMVMRLACGCHGDEGGGCRGVRLGSTGCWPENDDGAGKRGEGRYHLVAFYLGELMGLDGEDMSVRCAATLNEGYAP
ncbi:hypothetical protein Tco_0378421 [Tanacetum coccineum]